MSLGGRGALLAIVKNSHMSPSDRLQLEVFDVIRNDKVQSLIPSELPCRKQAGESQVRNPGPLLRGDAPMGVHVSGSD